MMIPTEKWRTAKIPSKDEDNKPSTAAAKKGLGKGGKGRKSAGKGGAQKGTKGRGRRLFVKAEVD